MDVGVRELRQRLAELLERAAAGEIVRVTHRGRAKALIVAPAAEAVLNGGESRVERGIQEGWIRPGRRDGPPPIPQRGVAGRMSSAAALGEDRDDEE
jgi:prevent-host-death family protein